MDADAAAERSMIADIDVAREHHVVGKGHVASDAAIVRDMSVRHQKAAVADLRFKTARGRAGVNRHPLTKDAIGADRDAGRFTTELAVLRRVTDRGEGIDASAGSDARVPGDDDMGHEIDRIGEFGIGTDDAKRADPHAAAEPCGAIDKGGRVNHPIGSCVMPLPAARASR